MKRGIFPGAGAIERLPRLVSPSQARRLLFAGHQIGVDEAVAIGLVDAAVPDNRVMTEARRICRDIASQSPAAIRTLKEAIRTSESLPLEIAREQIAAIRARLDAGKDYDEGLAAFAEGRAPRWSLDVED